MNFRQTVTNEKHVKSTFQGPRKRWHSSYICEHTYLADNRWKYETDLWFLFGKILAEQIENERRDKCLDI